MSLREEIFERMPPHVTDVKIERSDIHGLDAIKAIVHFNAGTKNMFLDINFAKKNQMNAEHMAAVINSHIKVQ